MREVVIPVKLHIYKKEDGTVDIYAKRTRPGESVHRLFRGVSQERISETIARAVDEMRNPNAQNPA